MASLPYPRSHKTIFPQNSRNTQKRLAEKKNLCTSVQSVGGSYLPEGSVGSACSVGDSYLKLCWCSGDRCPPKDCHATTTRLPRYNNNIATLQQQYCHATTTRLPRYGNKVATLLQNVEKRMEDETEDKLGDELEDRLEDNPYCSGFFQPLPH